MYNIYLTDKLINIVGEAFHLTKDQITGKNRCRNIVEARRIIINVLTREENFTLSEVGRYLNRDHATSIHHRTKHNELYSTDKKYKNIYDLVVYKYKTEVFTSFSDILELTEKLKEYEKDIKDLQSENVDLKYTILKLENKFREYNFMIPVFN